MKSLNISNQEVLSIKDVSVEFDTQAGVVRAVDKISFELKRGQILGIAGESGCGKSITALSILRLLPKPFAKIVQGEIIFDGKNIFDLPIENMHKIRGKKISMIFQEPMTALNPVHSIGKQIMEVHKLHFPKLSFNEKKTLAQNILEQVGIADPDKVMMQYPHQISGGMRQRVMIAMALLCEPDILIADEPTTALDVTVQAQILDLIKSFVKKTKMSVILITHDLGVIAQNCDEALIMYAGRIAEKACVKDLFANPYHPYTKGLLRSIPFFAKKPKTFLNTIKGNVPSLLDMPTGCRFAKRCPIVKDICKKDVPEIVEAQKGHRVACHHLTSNIKI